MEASGQFYVLGSEPPDGRVDGPRAGLDTIAKRKIIPSPAGIRTPVI